LPATIREQCQVALFLRLQTISGIASLSIERNHAQPVESFPTLVQLDVDGSDEKVEDMSGVEWRQTVLRVEGWLEAATPSALSAAVDELRGKAQKAILGDESLGGLAVMVELPEDASSQDKLLPQTPGAAFSLVVAIDYWIRPGDPWTLGP